MQKLSQLRYAAWGGDSTGYDWPRSEHGIYVDANDHVWLAGNDKDNDAQVLEFTRDGKNVGSLGRLGRYAGEFHWVHAIAIDSRGNLLSGEVDSGKP